MTDQILQEWPSASVMIKLGAMLAHFGPILLTSSSTIRFWLLEYAYNVKHHELQ